MVHWWSADKIVFMTTWKEDTIKALENLGGKAHRSEIFNEVKKIRTDGFNNALVGTIQKELEKHCKTSNEFIGAGKPATSG